MLRPLTARGASRVEVEGDVGVDDDRTMPSVPTIRRPPGLDLPVSVSWHAARFDEVRQSDDPPAPIGAFPNGDRLLVVEVPRVVGRLQEPHIVPDEPGTGEPPAVHADPQGELRGGQAQVNRQVGVEVAVAPSSSPPTGPTSSQGSPQVTMLLIPDLQHSSTSREIPHWIDSNYGTVKLVRTFKRMIDYDMER